MIAKRCGHPRYSLRKCATNDRTSDRTCAPHSANDAKVLASLPQRHQVSNQNLGKGYQPATSDNLKGSADQQRPETIGRRSNNAADEEEDKGHYDKGFLAEDVREFGKTRLKNCGTEEEDVPAQKASIAVPFKALAMI